MILIFTNPQKAKRPVKNRPSGQHPRASVDAQLLAILLQCRLTNTLDLQQLIHRSKSPMFVAVGHYGLSLNLANIKTKSYLLQAEIYKTDNFLESYPQFKIFLKSLKTNILLVIFGSFARLKAGKDSDLDLLVVSEKEQNLPFHLLPYKVHQVNLSENSFVKAIKEQETLIKEIEENHIILNNHSFYINAVWDCYGK